MIKNKKICFDLDGVICETSKSEYKKSKPKKKVIKVINKLYKDNTIIIFTARYMGRNNDKVKIAKKQGYKHTLLQLKNWNVSFDKLIFGKPSYDLIVDDKALGFKKDWYKNY